ncbi:hypothetical protein [Rugamonas apoptosis]|uniref:Uncharacterized protein n=1 Tax=Rugamonas apoptosis TaxID=2758570 RepID=A0A7W2FA37_9BURK|nr:hypothetical protein [Rugamonas apoptosis]MBA5687923.1 hypothetical protein [Rugamonas apoptosis]
MPIYVQHQVLGRIGDVFNAEAIWQTPGLALFARRPLLRDLLERCPREHRGRAATRCFSHVTLMLPQEEVDDDYHLTRGARARDLAQTLTALHQKDFGDLLGADQVRYDVVGADALAPGQIEVKFGHAVYLPAPDEKILFNVSVSRDSAVWHPVCPVYPDQRLVLIGADASDASCAAPGWPFGPDGAILIINDGPDAPPIVQMRPKDGFDCRFDPRSGYYTIKSNASGIGGANGGPRLLLKITRVGAVPATSASPSTSRNSIKPAVWQNRSAGRSASPSPTSPASPASPASLTSLASPATSAMPAGADLTALPVSHKAARPAESEATYAPAAQQRVSLVALALPRLSRYRDTGASALELPFDGTLAVSHDASAAIIFGVTANDELYARTAAGRQRVAAPATFNPVDGRSMALLAVVPEMAERYCALLSLAQPLSAPVAGGARFTFGRSSAMLAALRVLDSPRFLRRDGGADGASADRLGLSRTAFSFEATPQGYRIGRLAATQALYHLDDKLAFVATIAETSADAPYLLPAGHHLAVGHYVLRFEA